MDTCREVVIDCTSGEDVQPPTGLECRSRKEFDVFHGKSGLQLVENPRDDPLCQAVDGYPASPAAEDGSASGTLRPRGNGRGRDDDD